MPSITDGLFAARAGIQGHGTAIGVLADNIANTNTIGFKASRPEFKDLLAGNISGGSGAVTVGSGSNVNRVTQIFNQGTLEFTGRTLDVAIDGDGFFILQDTTGARFYSRAGNFNVDPEGNLRNQNDLQVLGFPEGGSGGLEALNINSISQENVETANVTVSGNLDSSATITAVPGGTPTFAQLSSAASFSTFVDVFDTLGGQHTVTMYFFNLGAGSWTVNAYVDGGEIAGGTAGTPSQIGTGTLTFGADGSRAAVPVSDFTATADWANGSTDASIDFLFNPMTQFAATSTISGLTQDGSGSGNVVSFNIEPDGTLFALLDNGQTSSLGQISLASFASPEGLKRVSGSLLSQSAASGEPVIGTPSSGRFGGLQSGAVEISTADIASDFIKLISLQRGFQGSSRIISTIDDLLNEIVNLG